MKLVNKQFWQWVGGLFFALCAVSSIQSSVISAVFFAVIAVFLLPPLTHIPSEIFKKPINGLHKGLIIFLCLLLAAGFTQKHEPTTNVLGEKKKNEIQTEKEKPTLMSTITPTVYLSPTSQKVIYKVIKVIDGDTIVVDLNGKDETIRIIGIDTPELVDPRKPVQCFAKEASDKAKSILTDQFVFLEADPTQDERDKYDRSLRYVFLKNSADYGKMMIEEGYAHEYTYQVPYKFQKEYKEAEKQAREAKRGLWADNACLTPTPTIILIPTSPPPTQQQSQIYVVPTQNTSNTSGFTCSCSKTCDEMSSCQEAYYQLNTCGCSKRDSDSDGVPCEKICN